jgi:hypothetical protein
MLHSLPRMEKMVIEVGIYGIISYLDAFHRRAIQFVPLNSSGQPILFRDHDPIFLHLFSMEVVKGFDK